MAVRMGWTGSVEQQFTEHVQTLPKDQQAIIMPAFEFAREHHHGQTRKSGEPYIVHPVGIALRLSEKYGDPVMVAAALLHDTVEDCATVDMNVLYETFGEEIGFLVDSLTKCETSFHTHPNIVIKDRIERLLWAGMQDVRVLLLKIADRENNLSTIKNLKENKQVRMAFETQAIYKPLKKILQYDQDVSVDDVRSAFHTFLADHDITNQKKLKDVLVQDSFTNIDSDMFGLVYQDSKSIVWKITNKETFKRICENESLKDMVRFLTVEGNGNWFRATFQFIKGVVIDDNIKIGISSYRTS